MSPRGRRASLPGQQNETARGLLDDLVVRCFAEDGSASRDFHFDALPVAPGLRQGLAMAFRRRTAPGAGLTSLDSMLSAYRPAVAFARYLSTLAWPPTEPAHLLPEHLDGYFDSRKDKAVRAGDELADLKRLLKHAEGLSEAVTAKLGESNPRRPRTESPKESYSVQELKRIADAARSDLRAAAARIRANREVCAGLGRARNWVGTGGGWSCWTSSTGSAMSRAGPAPGVSGPARTWCTGGSFITGRSTTSSASCTCPAWRPPPAWSC
ncbi:hypothetical protein GCM10010451_64790 [Streptomyces virens]|uniref:Uncharacterized protein n=1 Tax=Streptomyces virens TaxID=285572 RepID=A0ABP6Q5Y2_9ACTN|nr:MULTISPECIES: hypothetical protein [Streptomyces]MBA8980199.1 hypothetical protein [Streptomyces calvus]